MNFSLNKTLIASLCGIVAGLAFLVAGIAKIGAADQWELFLYSFRIFGFYTTTVIARLWISFEIMVGLMLIARLYKQRVLFIALGFIVLQLIGMVVLLNRGSHGSCFCFGTLVEMPPLHGGIVYSLILLLLIMSGNRKPLVLRKQHVIIAAMMVIVVPLPIILSPPDLIYHKLYPAPVVDKISQRVELNDSVHPYNTGSRVLLFSSPACYYFQLAAQKLSIMAQRTGADEMLIFYFLGEDASVDHFREKTGIESYPFAILNAAEVFEVTQGMFPTLLFLKEGELVKRSGYRDFSDRHLKTLK